MKVITIHDTGSHVAIIDDVWTTNTHKTEIGLVRELREYGIDLSEYDCADTTGSGFNLKHIWVN